jgi:rhodanese-related sulfurtransferase
VANDLLTAGYTQVMAIKGGLDAWINAGYETKP